MDRNQLYKHVHARILRWATSKVGEGRAPDLAQDVMLELTRKYSHLDDLDDLVPVAVQILKFKSWGDIRRRYRRKEDQNLQVEDVLLEYQGPSPEQWILKRELRGLLPKAVRKLSQACRELIGLQLEDKSLKEIIDHFQVPSGTIYARSSRCRDALRTELRNLMDLDDELDDEKDS